MIDTDRASIGEAEAVDALYRFLAVHHREARVEVVAVKRGDVEGRDAWLIETQEPLGPGEPEWFRCYGETPAIYSVEVATGRMIGLQVGGFRTLFPERDGA